MECFPSQIYSQFRQISTIAFEEIYRRCKRVRFLQQILNTASKEKLRCRGCEYNRSKPVAIEQPQTLCSQIISVAFPKYRGNTYMKVFYECDGKIYEKNYY